MGTSFSFFSPTAERNERIVAMADCSPQLQWLIQRKTSSFVLRKRNVKQPFSTEPLHLTNRHSYKYSTLVHKNVIGIENTKDKKGQGFVVVQKRKTKTNKPALSMQRTQLKSGPRRSLALLRNMIVKGHYRKDCRQAALKKASALLRANKPRAAKEAKPAKKAE